MSIWDEPSPSDFDRWETLLEQGVEPSTAARELGFTSSAFRRANSGRHADALQLSRDARFGIVDERMERWAVDDEAPPAIRLAWARRWNRCYVERAEISGADGGPIEVMQRHVDGARTRLVGKLAPLVALAQRSPETDAEDGPAGATRNGSSNGYH